MTCDPLAYTGGGQLNLLVGFAIACLVAGALLLLMTRRRGRVRTAALLVLLSAAAMSITAGTPTQAIASECPPAGTSLTIGQNLLPIPQNSLPTPQDVLPIPQNSLPTPQDAPPLPQDAEPVPQNSEISPNSLSIIQTSVMEGLAPGIEPVAITGIVSNNGTDSTDIIAMDVEIVWVIIDPDAAAGECDASDYVLLNSRMPVGRTLDPGGFTEFAGAFIGFNNKSTNQDTCKGAIVLLKYTANPS